MQKSKVKGNLINDLDDKVLVTVREIRPSLFNSGTHKSFYVPKQSNVNYLRTFISGKAGNQSKESIFLVAYSNILNNNDTMEHLQNKFKSKIVEEVGLQIQITSMASF